MKRIITLALFAISLLGIQGFTFAPSSSMVFACQQQNEKWTKGYVYERAKIMFYNIPDHRQVSPSVRNTLFTDDLYFTLEKAWNVPRWYNGIGGEEFLYYFVTGNGGGVIGRESIISTTIQSVGNNSCTVLIRYREYWSDNHSYSSTTEERFLVLVYINDEWYLDDFSVGDYIPSVKAQCKEYIQEEISSYQSGETLRQMKAESYTSREITKVNDEFNAFLQKYGLQVSGVDPVLKSYNEVSTRPAFKDGDLGTFIKWVLSRVKYPEYCIESHIEGDLVLSFTVDENGFIVDEKVVKSVEPSLDDEVMRYVAASPQWTPGKEYGNPVKTFVELTIPLRINGSDISSTTTSYSNSSSLQLVEEEVQGEAIPFQLVEVKPSFNGGDTNAFSAWVNDHLVYPELAMKNGIQGRVVIQFTVDGDGQIANVKILRGADPLLNEEAIRVVNLSPKWTPGQHHGKRVAVTYTFPVVFGLK